MEVKFNKSDKQFNSSFSTGEDLDCTLTTTDTALKAAMDAGNKKIVLDIGKNFVYGSDYQTYMLIAPDGTEIPAVFVENEEIFDATANDLRENITAATNTGILKGTKVIPSYHTTTGVRFVPNGSVFELLNLDKLNLYDFTELQAIICPYATTLDNSKAADKVVIDEGVYPVNSNEIIATVTRDDENKSINFGITNESGTLYLMRYFTYREI